MLQSNECGNATNVQRPNVFNECRRRMLQSNECLRRMLQSNECAKHECLRRMLQSNECAKHECLRLLLLLNPISFLPLSSPLFPFLNFFSLLFPFKNKKGANRSSLLISNLNLNYYFLITRMVMFELLLLRFTK
jgi:hypothetical protein